MQSFVRSNSKHFASSYLVSEDIVLRQEIMKATNFFKVEFKFFEDGIELMKKEISKGYF